MLTSSGSSKDTPPPASVEAFYDDFSRRFVEDIVQGNERVAQHLLFFGMAIPPDAHSILVIGSGSGESALFIAQRLATSARILAVDIQDEMRSARCFVQHSVEASTGDSEGMPVAILETGATGLPVVSIHHAGISLLSSKGETGFLARERDVHGMPQHMLTLAGDPQLAGMLGGAARFHIETHFSIERSLDQLWKNMAYASRTSTPERVRPILRFHD